MILVLDNYDSFTYNLVQSIGKLGAQVVVKRNDECTIEELITLRPQGIVLSPGPGRPEAAGRMPELVARAAGAIPIFGVCLGHQMIGLHFGAQVVSASTLVHGKATRVFHNGQTIFRGLSDPFAAGRYHSLAIMEQSLPDTLEVTARADDGEIMGVRHRHLPLEGVQFHPESILTPEGDKLIANVLGWFSGQ